MNKIFVYYVLYFIVFVFATFNGIIILKTKSFKSPFQSRKLIEGKHAVIVGSFLIFVGLLSLIVFIIGIKQLVK